MFCLVGYVPFLVQDFDAEQQETVMENGSIEEVLAGECEVDPDNELPPLIHYYQAICTFACCLIAIASMTFSCSRKKGKQWKKCIISIMCCRICRKTRQRAYALSDCVQMVKTSKSKSSKDGDRNRNRNRNTTIQMEASPISPISVDSDPTFSPTVSAVSPISENTELTSSGITRLTLANHLSVQSHSEYSKNTIEDPSRSVNSL